MNRKVFFDHVRANLDWRTREWDWPHRHKFHRKHVDGMNAILDELEGWPLRWQAYALATAYGETAHSMWPITEYGPRSYFNKYNAGTRIGKSLGNTRPGDGYRYRGRGYVQLTGRANYTKADMKLGLNGTLISNPERALEPKIAAKIMRRGMEEGWFTGKKLSDYFNDKQTDWRNARRIINGTDKASRYAAWAQDFHRALEAAEAAQNEPAKNPDRLPVAIVCMGTNDLGNPSRVKANTIAVIERLLSHGIAPTVVLPTDIEKLLRVRAEVMAAVAKTTASVFNPAPSSGEDAIHMTQGVARQLATMKPDYVIGDSNAKRVAMACGWWKFDHCKRGAGTDWIRKRVEEAFPPTSGQKVHTTQGFWARLFSLLKYWR